MPSNDPSAEQGFRTERAPSSKGNGPPGPVTPVKLSGRVGLVVTTAIKEKPTTAKSEEEDGLRMERGREGMPQTEEGKKGEGRQRAALRSKGISNAPSPLQCILLSPTRLKNVAQNNGMECVRVCQRFA